MRIKMVELFTGSSANLWFINELISVFPSVLSFNAGAIFVNDICDKIAFTINEWNESIIDNCELIFSTPSGPRILYTIFPLLNESQISKLANLIFHNFYKWKVNALIHSFDCCKPSKYQIYLIEVFQRFIVYYRNNPQVYCPLLNINFFTNTNYLFILIIILTETHDITAVKIILNNFDYCATSQNLYNLITLLYLKKNHEIRKTIFDKLISNHSSSFLSEPQWRLFRMIAVDGDLNHRDRIAKLLENSLNIENPPSYFGVLMNSIILSLPIQARVEFLKRNQRQLLRFTNFHQFSMLLQYTEMIVV